MRILLLKWKTVPKICSIYWCKNDATPLICFDAKQDIFMSPISFQWRKEAALTVSCKIGVFSLDASIGIPM